MHSNGRLYWSSDLSVQSRHAYDRWCVSGRQSVMDLLNKFWYSPLPPLGARSRYRVEHIHADYTVLLHRLLKYVILASHLRHRHINVQHHSFRHCYSVLAISSLQSVRCCRSEHCGNLSCLFCIPVRVRLCFLNYISHISFFIICSF